MSARNGGAASGMADALTARMGWPIGLVFFGLAAWFVYLAPPADIGPLAPAAEVSKTDIQPGGRRVPVGEPPRIPIGGFDMRCMECHRFFDSPPVERRILTQHTDITFRHGQNDRCFNCHDRRNRGKLVRYDGTLLGFNDVPRLCSQCHGTVYRDWQVGMHGKTMGSWDASSGLQRRLACHECHDPHAPAYPPYHALPGPDTLRMGPQGLHHAAGEVERDPLLKPWEKETHPASGADPHDGREGHEP